MAAAFYLSKAFLLAFSLRAVAALDLDVDVDLDLDIGVDGRLPCKTTITIPYVGTCTTSTTIFPCGTGPATLVIQTPIITQTCGPTGTTTKQASHTSTSHHTTTQPTTTKPIPTTTKTTTKTPEPTPGGPCPLIKPRCHASGLDIDYYSNPFAGYSREGSLPWSYYITQKLRPLQSSSTNVTFFPQDFGPPANLPKIYPRPDLPGLWYAVGWTKETNGGIKVDANNFTLVYSGFYRAPETGKYTLCTTADNENDIFFGHGKAFDCLTGSVDTSVKPLVISTGGSYVNGIKCADLDLVKDSYYPLRSVMGDWQGPSAFNVTIKTPSQKFEDRKNNFAGLAYPLSCHLGL
ncbi:floculation protein FLO1 [Pochonia chlamydosporia 170]|uniref:Floculation protein FLO1 n=1 Tax=Pochonia chlamydosporia 170 TaxID=1380566 RepID=A0A179FFZ9_METCM|nr:floculation protein FLO1 [Pochonia chlamydosporia 170]OAQ64452.1 floculation protein FLO1 [Pochonia chlamydosporia 170]